MSDNGHPDYEAAFKDLNEELDAMLYAFSHEVRAPLRSVEGFSQALEEDCAGDLSGMCLDYLNRIRKAVATAENLIQAVLRVSRRTRGEMDIQDVNLSRLAGEVVTWLRKSYPDRAVEVDIQDGLWARMDLRLGRVLLEELLSNSWRFTQGVSRPRVEFGMEDGDPPRFYVRDNGIGLPAGHGSGYLFGLFQVLHLEEGLSGQGTGLAVARRVANRHGGSIGLGEQPETGACFRFILPEARRE